VALGNDLTCRESGGLRADHSKPEAACPHAGRRPRLAAPGRMTGVHEHRDGGCVDLLAETDLAAAERRLRQAAAKGGLLDLASATGRRGPSGARSWLGTRAAELIEVSPAGQQLVEHLRADSFDTPAAVRLRGAAIVGRRPGAT